MRAEGTLLILVALAAVSCRRTPAQPQGTKAAVSTSAGATAPSALPAPSVLAETPPSVDDRASESDKSRCGLLTPPSSPSLVSLFGRARPRLKREQLESFMKQGNAGAPERVALIVDGTGGVMCECPPLSFNLLEADGTDRRPSLLTIPQKGVPSVGLDRTLLRFVIVGYFSGAWIDTFEYLRLQGDENPATDEETRSSYRELTTEFCLEASCYVTRDDEWWMAPDKEGDAEDRKARLELQKGLLDQSHEDVATMGRLGIPRCQREWLQKR